MDAVAAGAIMARTNEAIADGEIVWFWRPDAGAKFVGIRTTDDGGKRARSPGRARISRNTIVQGMPVDAVYPWLLTPVLFFCTGGHGCNAHPAFPAPSIEEGGSPEIKTRAKQAARSRGRGCNRVAAHPSRRR
jgi:hypothetical protein